MRAIRNACLASLASLALVVGCSTEEPATSSVPTPTPAPEVMPTPGVTPSAAPAATPATPEVKPDAKIPAADTKADAPKADAPEADTPKADAPKADAPKVDAPKVDAPKVDSPKADASKFTADELAEIKKLPADDQALAISQVNCPVGGEHLGGMGVPIKVSAEGKSFFICCKGCKKDVDADPKAVVAKLMK